MQRSRFPQRLQIRRNAIMIPPHDRRNLPRHRLNPLASQHPVSLHIEPVSPALHRSRRIHQTSSRRPFQQRTRKRPFPHRRQPNPLPSRLRHCNRQPIQSLPNPRPLHRAHQWHRSQPPAAVIAPLPARPVPARGDHPLRPRRHRLPNRNQFRHTPQ